MCPSDEAAVRRCLPELKREGALPDDLPAMASGESLQRLEDLERAHISKALSLNDNSIQSCADILGVTPRVLGTKMKKLGIEVS